MITILPEKRGKGPGFILIPQKHPFELRDILKPGDRAEISERPAWMKVGNVEIDLGAAEGFSSLLLTTSDIPNNIPNIKGNRVAPAPGITSKGSPKAPAPGGMARQNKYFAPEYLINFIGEYFQESENLGNSLLSRVIPSLLNDELQCSIGSCVLSVWKNAVDDILTHLRKSIENRDGEMFGEALKKLVGMGWGLTPGGDDFILAMLGFSSLVLMENEKKLETDELYGGFFFINSQIRKHLPGLLNKTGFISASYLKYALEGRYVASFADFLKSLNKESIKELERNLEILTEYGATSGMDMAAGVVFLMSGVQ